MSTYSLRSVANDSAYFEAENISESIFEKINQKKSSGLATFFPGENTSEEAFAIDCFDSSQANSPACVFSGKPKTGLKYPIINSDYFTPYVFEGGNPAYANNFFNWRVVVAKPLAAGSTGYSNIYNDNFSKCKAINGMIIPEQKCRMIHIQIKWSDQGRQKNYTASQYITGWER